MKPIKIFLYCTLLAIFSVTLTTCNNTNVSSEPIREPATILSEKGFEYDMLDDGIRIKGYHEKSEDLLIPEIIDGKK